MLNINDTAHWSRFHPIFSGPQVVNRPKRGQKEGQVVPKVVNREPILGVFLEVLFSLPSPRLGLWQFGIV